MRGAPVPSPARDAGQPTLGAILAGGGSRRFGSPKALARVGGVPIVVRVRDALTAAVDEAIVVTGDPEIARAAGLPARTDEQHGAGPVAGLVAALRWARERGSPGALVVACDMPFLDPRVLGALVARAAAERPHALVLDRGPAHGLEPLCAWYGVAGLPIAESRLRDGRRDLQGLLRELRPARVPYGSISGHASPEAFFMNVNTAPDLERAERLAAGMPERS